MKKNPLKKILLNAWYTLVCIIRVWDYNRFRKSLFFTYRMLRSGRAKLTMKLKGARQPVVFIFQLTGDVTVFLPEGYDTSKYADDRTVPKNIQRQLRALMYAPNIFFALITEIAGIVFLVVRYREEAAVWVDKIGGIW